MPISPFAPKDRPPVLPIAGVKLNSLACNLKPSGRPDLTLFELAAGSSVAGVFTRSLTAAAPVDWCKSILKCRKARALIVHAGNANAFTGRRGVALVDKTASQTAEVASCPPEEVYVAGTGIIGEPIAEELILSNIPRLHGGLREDAWELASTAIMTTDTYPKTASRRARIGDVPVTISGMAKGAGMIAPDMATMLCFAFTDARLPSDLLQEMLNRANLKTFSNISIDGDTSTNDTLLVFATGQAPHPQNFTASDDPVLKDFEEKLTDLLLDLALQVVRDGEGISKFITVTVRGARTDADAHKIARSIGDSPLVKTAIGGGSPNWGRVVMAVGKAGCLVNKDKLSIWFGSYLMAQNGNPNDDVDHEQLATYMGRSEIAVEVDVGVGEKRATIWTGDLTAEYVAINAEYKT